MLGFVFALMLMALSCHAQLRGAKHMQLSRRVLNRRNLYDPAPDSYEFQHRAQIEWEKAQMKATKTETKLSYIPKYLKIKSEKQETKRALDKLKADRQTACVRVKSMQKQIDNAEVSLRNDLAKMRIESLQQTRRRKVVANFPSRCFDIKCYI